MWKTNKIKLGLFIATIFVQYSCIEIILLSKGCFKRPDHLKLKSNTHMIVERIELEYWLSQL